MTDFDFGFDGKMYLADWVSSWNHNGQGRIYTLEYKNLASNPNILAMKSLVAEGFQHRSQDELASLLSHEDMRVRLRAQLELASRGATSLETFESLLRRGPQIQKIHAIWGLTILARDYQKNRQAYDHHPLSRVIRSASVDDAEIRAQVARAFGEARYVRGTEKVISELLHDENPRVLLFAAMAVGKNGLTQYADRLASILAENNDQDVFLRHGCVMGFTWLGDTDYLEGLRSHPSTAVRRGALLALRKLKDSNAITSFLKDRDESIVTEAARAIHDLNPAPESTAHLAELARNYSENSLPSGFSGENEALLRRIINANFRIGEVSNAENVLRLIQNDKLSDRIRMEAIRSVGDWIQPSALDRVLGWHRPVPRMTSASDSSGLQVLFNAQLPPLVNSLNKNLSEEIARAMAKLGILMEDDRIISTISNANLPVTQRLSAIQSLKNLDATVWNEGINAALDSDSPELIQAGLASLVETQGARAFPRLRLIFHSENPILKNAATLQIARLETPEAQQFFLNQVVGKLSQGAIDPSIHLEIHEAVSHSQNPEMIHALNTYLDSLDVSPDLREWMVTLHGGNVQRGQSLFESHPVAQCLRCHKVGSTGVGEAGPNLQGVASRLNPVQLIESLILPNATLSQGFGPVSAMPPMGLLLSKHEIRDILAYIKTLN
ncbi:MAG: c-type cytochrome [Verrucomicrobia bacterium]|nr:c-type cytochrome [Verrucomicrobiota bacterium]